METNVKGKLRESEPVSKEIPIILPKDLLRYLFGELGVSIDAEEVRRYWQHARECGCPWGNLSDGDHHIPCALYGDSAKYSYIGEKITCVFFSLPLWNPRAARYRIWLLFALETYQTLGGLTMNPLYRRIVESMWELYSDGLEVNGRTLHFAVSEIKGDWEWHVYSMGLSRSWRNPKFCWRCEASKNPSPGDCSYVDFADAPGWEPTQLSQTQFLARCIDTRRPGGPCAFDAFFGNGNQWNT